MLEQLNTVEQALVLHVANLDSIHGVPYGFLSPDCRVTRSKT